MFRAAAATQFLSNALNFGGQLLLPLWFLQVLSCHAERHRIDAISAGSRDLLRASYHGPPQRTVRRPRNFRCRCLAVVPRHGALHVRERRHAVQPARRSLCSSEVSVAGRSPFPRLPQPIHRCRANFWAMPPRRSIFASGSADQPARQVWRYSCNSRCNGPPPRCRPFIGLFLRWRRSPQSVWRQRRGCPGGSHANRGQHGSGSESTDLGFRGYAPAQSALRSASP